MRRGGWRQRVRVRMYGDAMVMAGEVGVVDEVLLSSAPVCPRPALGTGVCLRGRNGEGGVKL